MSKIKEYILKGTDKNPKILYEYMCDLDTFSPVMWVKGKCLVRNITICIRNDGIDRGLVTMKIILIPIIKRAICRDIWVTYISSDNEVDDLKWPIVKNQICPCTLDDIEDWINEHFQKG